METRTLLFGLLLVCALPIWADDIWTENRDVTWGAPIKLSNSLFSSAKAGDKVVVTYTGATSDNGGADLEFKVDCMGYPYIPGSRFTKITGDGTYEQFLTPDAIIAIKAHGLEVGGNNFHCTKIALENGKDDLKEGKTIWTGYFWMDEWTTLDLRHNTLKGIDWNRYTAIRFYHEANRTNHEANRTNYVINLVRKFEDPEDKIAVDSAFNHQETYAELTLTDDMRDKLADLEEWPVVTEYGLDRYTLKVQMHKNGGNPFNFTDIVLIPDPCENCFQITF